MPFIAYKRKRIRADRLAVIGTINGILQSYAAQGYDLTVRQLYYQFVANDLFPADRTYTLNTDTGKWRHDPNGTINAEPNYDWLADIVDDGRMNGLIDWSHIVDRTRAVRETQHWDNPAEIVQATAGSFKVDLWDKQGDYVEVWVEKDALIGVLERTCRELDVPHFASRGYNSQSNMWGASRRILREIIRGKRVTIVHMADHDPSGMDMTRDADDRLWQFVAMDYYRHLVDEGDEDPSNVAAYITDHLKVLRIALTMAQVQQYNPPPNFAKLSDSRSKQYIFQYGDKSWELDALDPPTLTQLIRDTIEPMIDTKLWQEEIDREQEGQERLQQLSDWWPAMTEHWAEVRRYMDGLNGAEPAEEPPAEGDDEGEGEDWTWTE